MTYQYPDEIEFAENPEQRCPVILLCDVSDSMRRFIEDVNAGLDSFKREVSRDPVAAERIELAVMSFSDDVQVDHDFALMRHFEPPTLSCRNLTNTALAVETALDGLRARKATYQQHGIPYYRPWMFLISDGIPTSSAQAMDNARSNLVDALHNRELIYFPIGLDQQSVAALETSLATGVPAKELRHDRWGEFFEWLSNSLSIVSRSTGDAIKLPPTNPWSGDIEIA